MPDEPDVDPAEPGGDLTARLKQLEDRIATEAPSTRKRRTPVRPTEPLVFPSESASEDAADPAPEIEPIPDAEPVTQVSDQPSAEPASDAPSGTPSASAADPSPAPAVEPVKPRARRAPRTATPAIVTPAGPAKAPRRAPAEQVPPSDEAPAPATDETPAAPTDEAPASPAADAPIPVVPARTRAGRPPVEPAARLRGRLAPEAAGETAGGNEGEAAAAAPLKKVAAKRVPAKKAAAKKVAAKKVAVSDLGERTGPWPVSQAPSPGPVRKAPGLRATPAPLPVPAEAAVAPVAESPAPTPTPPVTRRAVRAQRTEVVAAPVVATREKDGLVRFLVTLAVLLLAAAAGLGAAAFVEHRDASYRASVVVRLDPGPDPSLPTDETLTSGVTTYAAAASTQEFTTTAEQRASVAPTAVQGTVQAVQRAPRQLQLTVVADTAKEATALAAGAGDAFVELVNIQEVVNQPSEGDRLAAVVVGPDRAVAKTAPKDRDAWIAGVLAAAAVLVLAGVATLLRLTRRG